VVIEMGLEIEELACSVKPLATINFAAGPSAWFLSQSIVGDSALFLAHSDDGVIWGRVEEEKLITSDSVFNGISPPLRAITLQQARIFGMNAEVRVWRNGTGFQACRLEDKQNGASEASDESTILWGDNPEARIEGFTLVSDGRQGLHHAVPIDVSDSAFGKYPKKLRPLRLLIRHYLTYDRDGQARVALSRLVNLYVQGE
jgi:CRISPR-associated protein (TIGR03984 family)